MHTEYLSHSSVVSAQFGILHTVPFLRAVPYSSKDFGVCALNSVQFLASRLPLLACGNGKNETVKSTTEKQTRRGHFKGKRKPFWWLHLLVCQHSQLVKEAKMSAKQMRNEYHHDIHKFACKILDNNNYASMQ